MDYEAVSRDVEKRWSDPPTFRAAVRYAVSVIALAGFAFAATVAWHSLLAWILVPAILFIGAMGAFVRTYQLWRTGGVWPIWHGTGWALLVVFLLFFNVPTGVL